MSSTESMPDEYPMRKHKVIVHPHTKLKRSFKNRGLNLWVKVYSGCKLRKSAVKLSTYLCYLPCLHGKRVLSCTVNSETRVLGT